MSDDPNVITIGALTVSWFPDGDDPGVGAIVVVLDAPEDGYDGATGHACSAQFPTPVSTGISLATWTKLKAAAAAL